MTKKLSRILAAIMLIAAVGFLLFAFVHPELSFPWGNGVTYFLYGLYALMVVVLFLAPFQKK